MKSAVEPMDLWTVLRTGGLTVDNDEAVIHRARLCPQAPQAPSLLYERQTKRQLP